MYLLAQRFKSSCKIICVFFISLIISCVSTNSQREVRACKDACKIRSLRCQSLCVNDSRHCQADVMAEVKKSYAQYVYQQRLQGNDIALELQSFRDPLQCRKITCDCLADAHLCVNICNVHIKDRGKQ